VLERAPDKATRALLRRIILHLEEYKEITGSYPPDGIDSPVRNDQGQAIQSSASLYHHLSTPVKVRRMVAGVPRLTVLPPIGQFTASELTVENPDYPGVREILDRFGTPMHYDNTENGDFQPQGGEVHIDFLSSDEEHPPDPRTLGETEGGVTSPNRIQSRGFDLWSHGPRGHDASLAPTTIASWNLRE
jgi:hypothetical protein